MPDFQIGQRVRLFGDATVVDVNSEGQYAFEFASGNRVWVHPDDRDFEVESAETDDANEVPTRGVTTRVHRLAVPTSVTFQAWPSDNYFGDGQHYRVRGFTLAGESAFTEQIVPADPADEDVDSAGKAIAVVLRRLRQRGW